MKRAHKETDMYLPIKKLFESQGFIVRGEVKNCDIAAIREGELWIVEMKLSANLKLIFQAMKRLQTSNFVFVAIPRPKNAKSGNFTDMKNLLAKLGIGLITVALDSPIKHAEIILFPCAGKKGDNKKADALKNELLARTTDTVGGNQRAKINTAYRERCIELACLLEAKGPSSPSGLASMSPGDDIPRILRLNAYGWFQKVRRGVYEISRLGTEYLQSNENTNLVAFYKMKFME